MCVRARSITLQATTGPHGTRALDVIPTKIHQRCPIVLGSRADVEDLEQLYAKHADAASEAPAPAAAAAAVNASQ